MPDSILALMQRYQVNEQHLWLALVVLAILVVLMFQFRKPLRHWRQERRIKRAMKRLGARDLHNITLPDGLGGELMIDNLLLATDAILVVDVKRFDGLIFGGDKTDIWTQVINKRSYRFTNPDQQLKYQVAAVRAILPRAPVRGVHLFTHGASFPKGKPAGVLLLDDVNRQPRRPRLRDIPSNLREAWEELRSSLS